MKRLLLVITTVTLLLMFASSGEAWQVNVQNSTNTEVEIVVQGSHLFWAQEDCRVKVAAGQTGACVMPGGICPVEITGFYIITPGGWERGGLSAERCSPYVISGTPCCWNVNVEVTRKGSDGFCLLIVK